MQISLRGLMPVAPHVVLRHRFRAGKIARKRNPSISAYVEARGRRGSVNYHPRILAWPRSGGWGAAAGFGPLTALTPSWFR